MTMRGAEQENYRIQMQSFESKLDKIIELLEELIEIKMSEKAQELWRCK